jgi:hypothetical protein
LAVWARLAQQLRCYIAQTLQPGRQRRLFWEDFVNRAFGVDPLPDEEAKLQAQAMQIANAWNSRTGTVTLIPVESNDPELLTLKTMRLLQMADAIFYGRDIAPAILQLARREARRIPLVDEPFHDAAAQRLCADGKNVVVLKRA